ncbi:O-succinylbenzoic acid--CoA ligase [Agromyces flavus]|uniref:O-succinylbenzoic acid--CoA ligase n=1 Tax=Agromyces flavus TaxID=589382 RepID=A0A1H1XUN5_9MICO|nr:AMP-binding protein [Agromyces flavus]MCP2366514.1 O-succinylbenzoic acid--CoA ligase [Agromyces flavus]GGI44828.1 O-succinylbenzoic acid--CoA ligase [Agromyces flavus]SDT12940.1 O-succinylbenzoic acid--CoA ligase [Agromyces flavus]
MKPLIRVAADDTSALLAQLREAVLLDGLAVLPVPGAEEPADPIAGLVPDDVALVVETSGSTDAPKRVMLSGAALRASAGATSRFLGSLHGQWLLALPATYIAGVQVLVRSLVGGTEPAALPPGGFTAAAFAEAARTLDPDRPWLTSLVPVQLARLVEAAEGGDRLVRAALGSFERILLGGQAAPPGLVERAAELGARVHRTYGSSETAGGCVYDGMPLPGVDVRIVDDEVQLAGRMLAEGYLDDPERTARAFVIDTDGRRWYRTGDLGSVGDDGRLRIRGRADDVIISGGVKVALGEVERAVRSVAGFADAVVVRVPDAEWGERAAVVATRTDGAATSGSLSALAAATDAAGLGPAARPVRLEVIDAMPLLASGKPDRRALETRLRGGRVE